ncbi:MAG: 5-formyltetrahydrofolate cyclo-ligase [Actinobacteria bacterium]|nr:5-formyltetrahydrofolate cyclo-ligase [Actinomycetota bacterium]
MDDKPALRRRMRMVRDHMTDRLVRSVELWNLVAALPEYCASASVMAFVAINGEPDTDALFALIAADGKRLLLPRVEGRELVVCAGAGRLVASSFGVLEPTGPSLPVAVVELVIVPGLAFTTAGDRLGYGGGYYDRFLTRVEAPSVGVCFREQLVDELPAYPYDVRVQRVVVA